MIGDLFRPSGGVLYHIRARRQEPNWAAFRQSVGQWLAEWKPPQRELILVGPSGGYSLPTPWLQAFASLRAFDLDPLAGWRFRRRHRLPTPFERRDLFWKSARLSTEPMRELLALYPNAAVLFCNLIGQIPLEGSITESQWRRHLMQLRKSLEGRSWASYHDLYTLEPLALSRHNEVARLLCASDASPLDLNSVKDLTDVEIVDHMTQSPWTEGLKKTRFPWTLTPSSLHIVEGVTQT